MSPKSANAIDEIVGHNIRIHRMQRGMSQTDLAEQLGVSCQQVQKYEKGVNRVGSSRLYRLADVLEVPVVTLYDGADSRRADTRGKSALKLISERQPLRLVQAFAGIKDMRVRRAVVTLVEKLASGER
jgi:transcriptional regulator with XRE-family HTH domain